MPKRPRWTPEDSFHLYGADSWGRGFLSVNPQGHLTIGPLATGSDGQGAPAEIDLKELVDELVERGIEPPLLLRFSDILRERIGEINDAFTQAIDNYCYRGHYRGVYPIKVNQNRYLVEDLVRYATPYHYGLEAGSKPELLAVMAMLHDPEALVICNGYKDEEYVETALLASRLGPKVILVIEKPTELPLIAEMSRKTGVAPLLGVRARLSTRGAGHWEASGGDRSKFGLGAREIVETVESLRHEVLLSSFVLLHFHLGSQISSIRNIKEALREASWLYVNLAKMGVPLAYLDVGGGLGVDYDGTQSNTSSSRNYTLQEYANDVVYGVMEVCDASDVPHPTLVTEAGRATVAHHAVLVAEVLGVGERARGRAPEPAESSDEDLPLALRSLLDAHRELETRNLRVTYHDALQYRDECLTLFNLGHLSLEHRVLAEDVYWEICRRIRELSRELDHVPDDLVGLGESLADTYFANFSIFQSLPDAWAIDHLFPVMPIHRLDEHPERRGIIADITCDSDGCMKRFIDRQKIRSALDLHAFRGEPYYLGAFLVGAYQEILGDLHNLFGDTHAVHVALDPESGYSIEHVVTGDTVTEVLQYVEYQREPLVAQLRRAAEKALRAGRMSREQARQLMRVYEAGLGGYTYLERP